MSEKEKGTLGIAIWLAAEQHRLQRDKGGKPYILHPIRVMMRLRTDDEELMSIAILHDVVEDSEGIVVLRESHRDDPHSVSLEGLGFSERVIQGVDALTKRPGEDYDDFIRRCALNPDSKLVKKEDIKDNSDVTRLKGLREKDFRRLEKYCRSYEFLRD